MKRAQFAVGLSIAALAMVFPAMSNAPKAPPTEVYTPPVQQACQDMTFSVYFPTHEAMLSSYAQRALNTAGDQLAGCTIRDIQARVISADAASDTGAVQLSEARAAIVLDALSSRGIRARTIQTEYVPSAELISVQDTSLPMARRVELSVKAEPGYGL